MTIVLAAHDERWAGRFASERALLLRLLGDVVLDVHHIGSTSVPGLVAKPIVDLLLVARSLTVLDATRPALEAAGFLWKGEYGIPGRRYLVRPDPTLPMGKVCHVHAFAAGHPEIDRHLRFRDALLRSPDLRTAYAELKRALQARHRDDHLAYTQGKAAFIEDVLRE